MRLTSILTVSALLLFNTLLIGQTNVGIGTFAPDDSAILDLESNNQGFLIPRMSDIDRLTIFDPALGLMVFDTIASSFFYYDGIDWISLGTSLELHDQDGDTRIMVDKNYQDDDKIYFQLRGTEFFVMDSGRLEVLNTGFSTFIGANAGAKDELDDNSNVGIGYNALSENTSGSGNVAVGAFSLPKNQTGNRNTSVGDLSLFNNLTGNENIAMGSQSMAGNETGSANVAIGSSALSKSIGISNTVAIGDSALHNNGNGATGIEGFGNLAIGSKSLKSNNLGYYNLAMGANSLLKNTSGKRNHALGYSALYSNTVGNKNIAIGDSGLFSNTDGEGNIAIGSNALLLNKTGDGAIAIGRDALSYTDGYGGGQIAIGDSALHSIGIDGTTFYTSYTNLAIGWKALKDARNTVGNLAVGESALQRTTSGNANTALGNRTMSSNTTGKRNVAIGYKSLEANIQGDDNISIGNSANAFNINNSGNIGIGSSALNRNHFGNGNIAIGRGAMAYSDIIGGNVAIGDSAMYNTRRGASLFEHGLESAAVGYRSMYSNTLGYANSAFGYLSLTNNTTGNSNTAIGRRSLYSSTLGDNNTAIGDFSLVSNSTGNNNIALGVYALGSNQSGSANVAIGNAALGNSTDAYGNVAVGDSALYYNGLGADVSLNEGINNTAVGYKSIRANTIGFGNTALGSYALKNNSTGYRNTALGSAALQLHESGSYNTAIGLGALQVNFSGKDNTSVGAFAGVLDWSSYNTYVGYSAGFTNQNGADLLMLGWYADATLDGLQDASAIGENAKVNASYKIRLGNTQITSIEGQVNFVGVSDGRFKNNIKEDVPGLEFINKLRPLTYNFDIEKFNNHVRPEGWEKDYPREKLLEEQKGNLRASSIQYTGFIAQEVESVAKRMNFDFSGVVPPSNPKDNYGLRYAEFTVPLVKAVQELSEANEELKSKLNKQEETIKELLARMSKLESRM